jgi:hypothetical protein
VGGGGDRSGRDTVLAALLNEGFTGASTSKRSSTNLAKPTPGGRRAASGSSSSDAAAAVSVYLRSTRRRDEFDVDFALREDEDHARLHPAVVECIARRWRDAQQGWAGGDIAEAAAAAAADAAIDDALRASADVAERALQWLTARCLRVPKLSVHHSCKVVDNDTDAGGGADEVTFASATAHACVLIHQLFRWNLQRTCNAFNSRTNNPHTRPEELIVSSSVRILGHDIDF